MNRNKAAELGERMAKSWPGNFGIPADVWTEHMIALDGEDAERVVTRCVERMDRQPTVAGFLGEYHRARQDVAPEQRPYSQDVKGVSFGTYYERLLAKASKGDREAIEMVAIWEQNFAAKKPRMA